MLLSGVAGAAGLLAGASPASGAAWREDRVILMAGFGVRDAVGFTEQDAYLERTEAERWSIVAQPHFETGEDIDRGWRAEARVSGKISLHEAGATAFSIQGGPFWKSDAGRCAELGGEARAMYGRSFGERAFTNIEAAAAAQTDGCGRVNLDVTAGARPTARWLVLTQVFLAHDFENEPNVKAQLAVIRFTKGGAGLQLAVRHRLDSGGDETALVLGWWPKPRVK